MKAYDIWLDGKIIDTIFYGENVKIGEDEILLSLIDHDSYDPRIEITRNTHPLSRAYHFCESAREAWRASENDTQKFLDVISEDFSCPDCFGEYWTGWDIPARKVICNSCGARVQL